MVDTDYVRDAEQSIAGIAAELGRMRDAASLLEDAQVQATAMITAAERVVQGVEAYTNASGALVTRLAATDITQNLEDLHSGIGHLVDLVGESDKHITTGTTTLETRLAHLEDQVQRVANESRRRELAQITLLVLSIVLILLVLSGLLPGSV